MDTGNCTWVKEDDPEYGPLMQAVREGDVHHVEAALKPNMNVNAMYGDGFEGKTVLHQAAFQGHVDVIHYLLAHGAEVNVFDRDQFGNCTPLFSAARRAQVDAVRVLLDAEADMEPTTQAEGVEETILSVVLWDLQKVTQRNIDTIVLLLDSGADINARPNEYGPTVVSLTEPSLRLYLHPSDICIVRISCESSPP
jgi:Ankyrin repeats (many copies)